MATHSVVRFAADPVSGSGLNIYCIVFPSTGVGSATQVWDNNASAFVACNGANWADYAITMPETCGAMYAIDLPLVLQVAGETYDIVFYQRNGVTASTATDSLLGATNHPISIPGEGSGECPTVNEIADAVWDELRAGHTINGSYGQSVNLTAAGLSADAATEIADETDVVLSLAHGAGAWGGVGGGFTLNQFADAVWDEDRSGHTTANTYGLSVNVTSDGLATSAVSEITTATEVLLAALHGDGQWDAVGGGGGSGTCLEITTG